MTVRPVPGKPGAWIVPDPAEHRMGVRLDPAALRSILDLAATLETPRQASHRILRGETLAQALHAELGRLITGMPQKVVGR